MAGTNRPGGSQASMPLLQEMLGSAPTDALGMDHPDARGRTGLPTVETGVPPPTVNMENLQAGLGLQWILRRLKRAAEGLRPIVQGSLDDDPRGPYEEVSRAADELETLLVNLR